MAAKRLTQKQKKANKVASNAKRAATRAAKTLLNVAGEYRPRIRVKGYQSKPVGELYRRDRNWATRGFVYHPTSGRGIFGRARSAVRSLY